MRVAAHRLRAAFSHVIGAACLARVARGIGFLRTACKPGLSGRCPVGVALGIGFLRAACTHVLGGRCPPAHAPQETARPPPSPKTPYVPRLRLVRSRRHRGHDEFERGFVSMIEGREHSINRWHARGCPSLARSIRSASVSCARGSGMCSAVVARCATCSASVSRARDRRIRARRPGYGRGAGVVGARVWQRMDGRPVAGWHTPGAC